MKTTLREKIEGIRDRLEKRISQLEKHIAEYKEAGNYVDAGNCQIKLSQLSMIHESIVEALR
jgi:hypothetical protein